jgi:hypothetical protein
VENYIFLSRSVQVAGVIWWTAMMIDKSRRPDTEDQKWSSTGQILGGQTIERLGDVLCGLHCAHRDEECGFLG